MKTEAVRRILGLVVLVASAPTAAAQRFVSWNGAPPPTLTAVPAPPAVTPPPCVPLVPPCPIPPIPGFPAGVLAPSLGGEAIDEATGIAYVTDGPGLFTSVTYPGCAPAGPIIPTAAWPPGPCGPVAGPPWVAMCDSVVPGAIWVLNAAGIVSLVPVAPGPPLAQGFVPLPIPAGTATGITFDSTTGFLWFTSAVVPIVASAVAPAVGAFPCGPLPAGPIVPVPPCLPPPFIGVTLNTAVAPGPIPALTVSNGVITANVATGACTCPAMPPALIPTTDIDFADIPFPYGVGCGCAPPTIGTAGGYPVLGNAGFTITAAGVSPGVPAAALFLSGAPAAIPFAPPCTLLLAPPLLYLATVPVLPTGAPPCIGTAALGLPVPGGPPALVGVPIYFQWAFFPSPLAPGFEVSNGLEVVIGFP